MKYAVIIAAGGQGRRFGVKEGKQLFEIDGQPMIIKTIKQFIGQVDQIIVVFDADSIDILKNRLAESSLVVDKIIAGGQERYDSVIKGLSAVSEDIDSVLIHDGARPNVSAELVVRCKKALLEHSAVVPVIPVCDTIKVVKNNLVVETPPRSSLFAVQTPQCFKKELIVKAYSSVELAGCTDDAMLVERCGEQVFTIEGEVANIKITTKDDLRYLK